MNFLSRERIRAALRRIPVIRILMILAGTAILSFGLVNIHQRTGITEGGVLGLVLFLNHWFAIPSSIASPLLDLLCYLMAWKTLGKSFIRVSLFSTTSLALFFKLWEALPPLLPDLSATPLLAAIAGASFVGIGVGLVVRQGGSSGGDDALALTLSRLTRWKISRAYAVTDVTVLMLSLSYIPFSSIIYSLITVMISSQLIEFIVHVRPFSRKRRKPAKSIEHDSAR